MKFNTVEKTVDGVKFVFVTRGRSKPFDRTEMKEYFNARKSPDTWPVDVDCESVAAPFKIRDELRLMFLKDMRQYGVKHCMNKYGGTSEQITSEATRVAPYMNRDFKK